MNKREIYFRSKHSLILNCLVSFLILTPLAKASVDLDNRFELSSIGVLRSSDNVDGLFNDYVGPAYRDYFSHQSRFTYNDLSSVDATLDRSHLPYTKLIMDRDILSQLAKSSRSQSLLRTKIFKEGNHYHFILDWLHAPHMELLGSVEFNVEDPTSGKPLATDALSNSLKQSLARLINQVPFQGNVTGRDGNSVTINLGSSSGIKKGDNLLIGTLDEVKQHPLLKKIVEWKSSPTGKLEVEQAEDGISFCKILEETPGREISRSQKIFQIQKQSPFDPSNGTTGFTSETNSNSPEKSSNTTYRDNPKLGNLSISIFPGFYDRQFSNLSGTSLSGGGLAYGAKASGEVLLTSEWFAGIDFKFSFLNFSQKDSNTGINTPVSLGGGVAESTFSYKLNVGYLYLLNGDMAGPKGWIKGSYKSDSYNMPITSAEFTGPISFDSFMIGAGAELPLRGGWGTSAEISVRLITNVTQTWLDAKTNGSSDVEFYLGGYYKLNSVSTVKLGIDVVSNGSSFEGGANLNQKTVSIVPSLLYYF